MCKKVDFPVSIHIARLSKGSLTILIRCEFVVPPRAVSFRRYCSKFGAKTVYIRRAGEDSISPDYRRSEPTPPNKLDFPPRFCTMSTIQPRRVSPSPGSHMYSSFRRPASQLHRQSYPLGNRGLKSSEVHLLQCTYLHGHAEARRAFSSLIARASFSTGGLAHAEAHNRPTTHGSRRRTAYDVVPL